MGKKTKKEVHLRLYLAGDNRLSRLAVANLKNILASIKDEECRIEFVDILKEPLKVLSEGIFATPTLDKLSPPPRERMIGDLSDYEKVISILKKDYSIEVFYEEES